MIPWASESTSLGSVVLGLWQSWNIVVAEHGSIVHLGGIWQAKVYFQFLMVETLNICKKKEFSQALFKKITFPLDKSSHIPGFLQTP